MLPLLAAAVLAVHGLIHLIGFVVPWGLAQVDGFTARTSVLAGAISVGDAGARVVGVAWLLAAVGFVVAAIAVARGAEFAGAFTAGLVFASIGLCLLGLPEAATGIPVNLAILGALAWSALAHDGVPAVLR
jgi:hypothetical protein